MISASPADIAATRARIAAIPALSMEALWALWDRYFDERPAHHHRTWLETRLAYRIQELAFGSLKPAVRTMLEDIGERGELPASMRREADRLLPGSMLTRVFDDAEHQVYVHGKGSFEYRGRRYTSLTAIAKVITGNKCSGPAFFGLKTQPRHTDETRP